jgi:DNA-binding MarR family transcriptional regulator
MYLASWYDIKTELETASAQNLLQFQVVLRSRHTRGRRAMKARAKKPPQSMDDAQYAGLAGFRRALRQLMADSERICGAAGLTTQRFQALLAIRAAADGSMSIGALAEELVLRHHSAVELVGRLELADLVQRQSDPQDKRRVLVSLTRQGAARLDELAREHAKGLSENRDIIIASLTALPETD